MGRKRFKPAKLFRGMAKMLKQTLSGLLHVAPVVAVIGILAGVFFGVRGAPYADPGLMIRQVYVQPRQALSDDKNKKLVEQLVGRHIFNVNLHTIAEKLERDPSIQNVTVQKRFPNAIEVNIHSRKPLALIRFSPDGFYGLVTDDGMIIDLYHKPVDSYVVIEAYYFKSKSLAVGYHIEDKGFFELIHFLEAYWKHSISLQEPLSRVTLDRFGNVTIIPGTGPEIRLGRKPMDKLPHLDKIMQLLDQDGREEIDYVDLQFDNMVVKRKG